ncbi:MAG TPA: hypothetical protein VIV60_23745, partial [Polyangiaceae bacterium]
MSSIVYLCPCVSRSLDKHRFEIALTALSIAFGWCLYPRNSLAETRDSSAGLRYDAPAECPTKPEFLRAILLRSRQLPSLANDDTDAFTVRI